VDLTFQPRPYQIPLIKALNSGIKRAVFVAHRRAGKDILAFNWAIFQLLLNPGWTAFHILPTYNQAKKVIWDANTNESKRLLDYIPSEVIEAKNGQEMKIRFTNGSLYQLIGSDNIDSLVGTNPKIIIFSEYAIQSPAAWEYLRPILDVNKGYALFISTPRGKNHFYDLMCMARNNKDWFCEILSIKDTGVLNEEDIDNIRSEGVSDELIQQEYYCSFNRGVEGSYYGRLVEKAREEGRICSVPYEPRSPVHTSWDIGFGDSTAITFWQEIGGEIRIIDFYENQGEGIAHYAKQIQSKPYVYGTHYMPHDAGSGSIQTGRTLQDVAWEQGLKTTILSRETDIAIGIEAVRSLLSICFIDENKCKHLIKCLENYHKKFNDKTQAYSETPLHDYTSHAADSVRYMANARTQFGRGPGSLTPDKLNQLKTQAGFGQKPKGNPGSGPISPFYGPQNDNPYSFRR
jgi:phage terminase large subunit